jgi:multidrug efflux pump subunit AcrA (membrane-fusion protein)
MKRFLSCLLLALPLAVGCEGKHGAKRTKPAADQEGAGADGSKAAGSKAGKQRGGRRGQSGAFVAVRAQRAEAKDLPEVLEVVAVLAGRKQAEVYSRVSGKVSYIGPTEGRRVKEGEVLFRVDRSDPGESFLATPVVSPISGWVGRWLVTSTGAQVTAQQPVVSVVDDEQLKTSVMLPTDQWLRVSEGAEARVSVGSETRIGKVTGIARAAESTAARGTVTLEIPNTDHTWKAGMVATVAFDLDVKPRMVVPASSLSITDQGSFVFLVKDGKAERAPVKFSVIDNDRVEILEGVAAGASLVTEGVNQVGDGVAVKVVEDDAGGKAP